MDANIDLIVSNNGINNVRDINQVFKECSRIIRPNGQFVFTFNLDKSLFEFYHQLEDIFIKSDMQEEAKNINAHISEKRPSIDFVVSALTSNGFILKNLVYDQFNYKFSNGTAMLNHYFIQSAFMKSWLNLIPKNKQDEIFSSIECRFNQQARETEGVALSVPFVIINAYKKGS